MYSSACFWVYTPSCFGSARLAVNCVMMLSSTPISCTTAWSDSSPIALKIITTGTLSVKLKTKFLILDIMTEDFLVFRC